MYHQSQQQQQNGSKMSQGQNQGQGHAGSSQGVGQGQGQNQGQGHPSNPVNRPFHRNPGVQTQGQGKGGGGGGIGIGGKGPLRTSSWTTHGHSPIQQHHPSGHGASMGVLSGRHQGQGHQGHSPGQGHGHHMAGSGLGRAYSMSSFHPPLCAYTPSPGLGFGAWAKGPPAGLGNNSSSRGEVNNGGHCRPTMIPNYPPPPGQHQGQGHPPGPGYVVPVPQHHSATHNNHQNHIGFGSQGSHSQFPFYYNHHPAIPALPPTPVHVSGGGVSGPTMSPNVVTPCLLVSPAPQVNKVTPTPESSSSSGETSGETSGKSSLSTSGNGSSSRPGSSGSGCSTGQDTSTSSSGSGSGSGKLSDATVTASSSSSTSGLESTTTTSTSTSAKGSTSTSTSSSEKDPKVKVAEGKGPPAAETPSNPGPKVPPTPVFRNMTDFSVTHNLCAFCCKKNARLCTGCRHVAYCSEKCQRSHWTIHKWKCDPPVIVDKELARETMRREKVGEEEEEEKEKGMEVKIEVKDDDKDKEMAKGAGIEEEIKGEEVELGKKLEEIVTKKEPLPPPPPSPRPQRYNSAKDVDLSGLSQEKLEFRSKIAQLSAVLADSLGLATSSSAAKLYEDQKRLKSGQSRSRSSTWSQSQDQDDDEEEFPKLPENTKPKCVVGSSTPPPTPKPTEDPENKDPSADSGEKTDKESQTEGESTEKEGFFTGRMATRKEVAPCGLLASISPIMITCCNTMLTPNPPDSVICLNCTRWYQSSLGYRCNTCRWPVCSIECEKSYLHASFECKVFSASKRFPPPLKDHNQFFNDAVLIIRCLLLKSVDPPKYAELEELMPFCDQDSPYEKTDEALRMDKRILNYLKNDCGIAAWTELDGPALLNFINVVDVCSIVVQDRIFIQVLDTGKSYYAPKFVFPMKLYVTQDCIPNSKWSIKHSPKFEECFLRIHASIRLQPKTLVTTCFNSDKHVIGSWFQNDLSTSKFKRRCTCDRCRDPTEGGSYFSGFVCTDCNPRNVWGASGYLVPKDTLSSETEWVCNNPNCDKTLPGAKIKERIMEMHNEIHHINIHEDFYALVNLKWKLEAELHRNHFLLLKISVICVMLFWGSVRGLPFFSPRYDFFISTINLAYEALRVYDYICPGMSIQRARVLFQLQVAFAYKHLRDIRRYMEWGGDGEILRLHRQSPTPGVPMSFWDLMKIQQEAANILETEPYGTMENEMAVVLQEVIDDQRDLLSNSLREVNLEMTAVYNLHKIYTRFSNQYYYPAVPIYEDKDIQEFEVMTGPCGRHLLEKINFPF